MTTVQDLMKLADAHADAASKYQLESIYGKSKSYTLEKDAERDEARDALQSALEAQAAEIEWLKSDNEDLRRDEALNDAEAKIAELQSKLDAMQSVEPFGYVSEHNCEGPYKFQFHKTTDDVYFDNCKSITAVCTHPKVAEPLTDEQIKPLCKLHLWMHGTKFEDAYNAGFHDAEAAHGITKGQQ